MPAGSVSRHSVSALVVVQGTGVDVVAGGGVIAGDSVVAGIVITVDGIVV